MGSDGQRGLCGWVRCCPFTRPRPCSPRCWPPLTASSLIPRCCPSSHPHLCFPHCCAAHPQFCSPSPPFLLSMLLWTQQGTCLQGERQQLRLNVETAYRSRQFQKSLVQGLKPALRALTRGELSGGAGTSDTRRPLGVCIKPTVHVPYPDTLLSPTPCASTLCRLCARLACTHAPSLFTTVSLAFLPLCRLAEPAHIVAAVHEPVKPQSPLFPVPLAQHCRAAAAYASFPKCSTTFALASNRHRVHFPPGC